MGFDEDRFGSVAVSFYGVATVDGMNEKGLVANILYRAAAAPGKTVQIPAQNPAPRSGAAAPG